MQQAMINAYVTLILAGRKTLYDVPITLRGAVEAALAAQEKAAAPDSAPAKGAAPDAVAVDEAPDAAGTEV